MNIPSASHHSPNTALFSSHPFPRTRFFCPLRLPLAALSLSLSPAQPFPGPYCYGPMLLPLAALSSTAISRPLLLWPSCCYIPQLSLKHSPFQAPASGDSLK